MNPVLTIRQRAKLTQAELARRAGTSQPTIAAYEAGHKSPTWRTIQRLAASTGLEVHATVVPAMTREERRSLALHTAIARRLTEEPDTVVEAARRNVATMRVANPGATAILDWWSRELDKPVEYLAEVLVDPRPWARELRHVTPFAGVLAPRERWDVYRSFRAMELSRAS